MTTLKPTDEQQAVLDAFLTGEDVVVEAGAGSGKTSTLRMLADARPNSRMAYIAFNRAIADEAKAKFPRNADCRTAHSIAFASHGRDLIHKTKAKSLPTHEVVRYVDPPRTADIQTSVGSLRVSASSLTKLATGTVDRFVKSADPEIGAQHVPHMRGILIEDEVAQLEALVLPLARKVWADRQNPGGVLRFSQDDYLKMWALSGPRIDADVILYDEAQDADANILAVVKAQEHAQKIVVGDSGQAIYGWRGACDSMNLFGGIRLPLTRSFRFGPAVADEANVWLELLGSDMRISGTPSIDSTVGTVRGPDAILCRSNGGVIGQLLLIQGKGFSTSVGGKNAAAKIKGETNALDALMRRGRTEHPSFWLFPSYDALLQDIDETEARGDRHEHALIVKLVEKYGCAAILRAIERCVPSEQARVMVSTVHVAKGLEWDRVRINDDFHAPGFVEDVRTGRQVRAPVEPEEGRLAYVAVTRAKWYLDPAGVEWGRTLLTEQRAAA